MNAFPSHQANVMVVSFDFIWLFNVLSSGYLPDKTGIETFYYAQYLKRSPIHRKVEGGSGLSAWLHPL